MKIVFAASEAAPFIKTGGLGDVAEALPAALSAMKGNEVCIFLPYYNKIKNNPNVETEFVKSFSVDLSWRKQHCGVFRYKCRKKKWQVYFIDNEYYFDRANIYGEADDGERFAFFSKAILQSLVELQINPDVIHCNDWQTALVPVLLHAQYHDVLGNAKTVFTIHNIEYQGKADPYFIGDMLGLDGQYVNTLTYDGCTNFLKGALLSSDMITTVSSTYADELTFPYYSHGMSPIISEHSFKLKGIVNGINTDIFNPAADKALVCNYDINSFKEGKAANKKALQQKLGLDVREDVALIGMVSRLVSHKGLDLICDKLGELMGFDIQLVVIGTGDAKYENAFKEMAYHNSNKLSVNLVFDPAFASQVYAACDMYLMPSKSEPCGLSQMIAMRYGTVPIVNATGGLKDTVIPFNSEDKTGTGFNFQSYNADDMLGAIRRALEIYGGDRATFDKIVHNAMSGDYSWKESALKYMDLYSKLM